MPQIMGNEQCNAMGRKCLPLRVTCAHNYLACVGCGLPREYLNAYLPIIYFQRKECFFEQLLFCCVIGVSVTMTKY